MSTNQRSMILVGVAILLLAFFFYIFGGNNNRVFWGEHYRSNSEDPYGTLVIHELLPDYFPGANYQDLDSRFDSLPTIEGEPGNYIYIGKRLRLDSLGIQALLEFVQEGNTAFVAANNIPYKLMDMLFPGYCDEYIWSGFYWDTREDTDVRVLNPSPIDTTIWEPKVRVQNRLVNYSWSYITPGSFCEHSNDTETLGEIWNTESNFVKLNYGEGAFLFHSNPILFTNYFLKEKQGIDYASQVFSHLSDGDIFWDNYSLVNAGTSSSNPSENRSFDGEGPLSYVLSERSLSWAWYLLLIGTILFLVFRAKRKQRVIPVLEPNRNTSLEFITNIGRLYFLKPNHRKLALEQMRLFYLHIRTRYHLQGREADEAFIKQLAARSGVAYDNLESIFRIHKNIEDSKFLSENALISFHRKLEYFYQNCK